MTDSVTIIFRTADGTEYPVTAPVGTSGMLAAIENNVPGIEAECGGSCICATCHVYFDPGALDVPAPGAGENEMLMATSAERRPTSRLSCQIRLTAEMEGMVFVIPESQF